MNNTSIEETLKIISIIFLFLSAFICGIFPFKSSYLKKNPEQLSYINCFSGGVILAAALIHLFPDAQEIFLDYERTHKPSDPDSKWNKFPYACFLMMFAICFLLWIERIAFDGHSQMHNYFKKLAKTQSVQDLDQSFDQLPNNLQKDLVNNKPEYKPPKQIGSHQQFITPREIVSKSKPTNISSGSSKNQLILINKEQAQKKKFSNEESPSDNRFDVNNDNLGLQKTRSVNLNTPLLLQKTHIQCCDNLRYRKLTKSLAKFNIESSSVLQKNTSLTPFILLIALSFHKIFEGIAIGLQSELCSLISILIAVGSHTWAVALSLGTTIAKAEISITRAYILIFICAIIEPIGIVLGMIFVNINSLIQAIFTAIAAGTFIYIAITEILIEEFSCNKAKLKKFIYFIIGISFMIGVWFLE